MCRELGWHRCSGDDIALVHGRRGKGGLVGRRATLQYVALRLQCYVVACCCVVRGSPPLPAGPVFLLLGSPSHRKRKHLHICPLLEVVVTVPLICNPARIPFSSFLELDTIET